MGDDRPLRYVEADGTVVYRASGLGACDGVVLGLAAGRKPNQTPAWLQEVYDEGTRMEASIVAKAQQWYESEYDQHLDWTSQDEWELEVGEINDRRVIVRGHSDGWDADLQVFGEAKKFRDSTWPKFLSKKIECNPLYPWQVSVYMHAAIQQGFNPSTLFIGGHYDKENGEITEIDVFEYPDPPIPLKAIRKRIARWENMIADGLDVTDLSDPCTSPMFPCAMFGKGCPNEVEKDEPLALTGEHAFALEQLMGEWQKNASIITTANRMLTAAKERKKELEEGIRGVREALVNDGVVDTAPAKLRVGDFVVAHITGSVPEKVTKGYELDYFKVTAPKEGTTPS